MTDDIPLLERTVRDKTEADISVFTSSEKNRTEQKPTDFYKPYLDLAYYHGLILKQDVPDVVTKSGEFLLRFGMESDQAKPFLSVAIKGEVLHVEIKSMNGKYSLDKDVELDSIEALVTTYLKEKKPILPNVVGELGKPARRQRWQLKNRSLRMDKKLGAGQFGKVFRGVWKTRNREKSVAIKICYGNQTVSKEKMFEEVMHEVRIMRPLKHKHVVRLYGVAMDYEPIMIVMECVKGNSLQRYLRRNIGKVTLTEKVERMMLGAALGLEYIHNKKIIHRDIAARNCLYDQEGTCKISDFGLAKPGDQYKLTVVQKVAFKHMAPETFKTFRYTPKTDVFAFGVMIWEVFTDGKEPFLDKRLPEVKTIVTSGGRLGFPEDTPDGIKELVQVGCWAQEPKDRDTMKQVVGRIQDFIRRPSDIKVRPNADDELIEPGMIKDKAPSPGLKTAEALDEDQRSVITSSMSSASSNSSLSMMSSPSTMSVIQTERSCMMGTADNGMDPEAKREMRKKKKKRTTSTPNK